LAHHPVGDHRVWVLSGFRDADEPLLADALPILPAAIESRALTPAATAQPMPGEPRGASREASPVTVPPATARVPERPAAPSPNVREDKLSAVQPAPESPAAEPRRAMSVDEAALNIAMDRAVNFKATRNAQPGANYIGQVRDRYDPNQ